MTELDAALDATTAYPQPRDSDEMHALLDLVRPHINKIAAMFVAAPVEESRAIAQRVMARWTQETSPYSLRSFAPDGRDCQMQAKQALAYAVSSQPACTQEHQDLMISILSGMERHRPSRRPGP